VPEGEVIRTNPPAGSTQEKGTAITVVVSSGPAESTVPSVVGLTEANAINTLDNDGFNPTVVEQDTSDPTQDGRVLAQDPAGNATAQNGSTVTITVGRFVAPTDGEG
jgi:beta-lactam-binding protein with PASTA domain